MEPTLGTVEEHVEEHIEASGISEEHVEDDLLVEEVSIDGMCGVY